MLYSFVPLEQIKRCLGAERLTCCLCHMHNEILPKNKEPDPAPSIQDYQSVLSTCFVWFQTKLMIAVAHRKVLLFCTCSSSLACINLYLMIEWLLNNYRDTVRTLACGLDGTCRYDNCNWESHYLCTKRIVRHLAFIELQFCQKGAQNRRSTSWKLQEERFISAYQSTIKLIKASVADNKCPLKVLKEVENSQGGVMELKLSCDLPRDRKFTTSNQHTRQNIRSHLYQLECLVQTHLEGIILCWRGLHTFCTSCSWTYVCSSNKSAAQWSSTSLYCFTTHSLSWSNFQSLTILRDSHYLPKPGWNRKRTVSHCSWPNPY